MSMAAVRKAAVLVQSLSDDEAAPLLAQLKPAELAALAHEIARQQPASPREQAVVFAELTHSKHAMPAGVPSASASVRPLSRDASLQFLTPAARRPLERFSYLRNVDSPTITQALREEHLQTVALVLNHLPTAQRDRILRDLPPGDAASVVRRLDALGQVRSEVVDDVERGLEQNLAMALRKWLPEAA